MRSALRWNRFTKRPEEVGQVVLEPRAGQEVRDGVHGAGDGGCRRPRARAGGAGRCRPGRAGGRTAPVRQAGGSGRWRRRRRWCQGTGGESGFIEHGGLPVGEGRDRRGLRGDRKARGGAGRHPAGRAPAALTPRGGPGAGAERRTASAGSFASRCKGRRPAEKSWRAPLRAWPAPGSSRPFEEGRGAALSRDGREPCSTEAPSPAIVIGALAALRRPAPSLRAGAASATGRPPGRAARRCARRARPGRAARGRC